MLNSRFHLLTVGSGQKLNSHLLHVLLTAILSLVCIGCSRKPVARDESSVASVVPELARDDTPIEKQVELFCGACHPVPPPSDFPKHAWREEVQQGYDLYFQSARVGNLRVPLFNEVLKYFEDLAPVELAPLLPSPSEPDSPLEFREESFGTNTIAHSIAHINAVDDDERTSLLVTDMRSGDVLWGTFQPTGIEFRHLAKLRSPAHIEPSDLDADGERDFVIADLGDYPPADHDLGRVIWLRPISGGSEYEAITLLESIGRISDVQPSDLDQDGDQDLLVAEFGWRRTGAIRMLENKGADPSGESGFISHTIDERHGAIHVPTYDINEDGKPDFLTIFGQEHETVEVFFGDGSLAFQYTQIFQGDTPAFGSSGMQLADIDSDGDMDVLCTNGDMLDDYFVRNSHAIRWLENCGNEPWKRHEIARLPGVTRAIAADLDGDGDVDVVACAFVPKIAGSTAFMQSLDSLIWLEQRPGTTFVRHVIETGRTQHAALEVGDLDGDHDLDIVAGFFSEGPESKNPRLSVWWNESVGSNARVESR